MDTRGKSDAEFRNEVHEILARHESSLDQVNAALQTVLTELQALRHSRNPATPTQAQRPPAVLQRPVIPSASSPFKPLDQALYSSQPAANTSRELALSGNGFSSNSGFGGDVFATNLQSKPDASTPSSPNEKREKVVKASRDVTMNSKKVIFQVHRISKENKEEVLMKAEKDLAVVTDQYMSRLVKELERTDFWKLRRAYTSGVQEYIEAATFCKFCKTGTLLQLDEINAGLLPLSDQSVEPLQINILDYILGIADLTGELMRLAIGRISDDEVEYAQKICRFVRDIYRELTLLVPIMDDNYEKVGAEGVDDDDQVEAPENRDTG